MRGLVWVSGLGLLCTMSWFVAWLYTEWLWFESVGQAPVLLARLTGAAGLFVVAGGLAAVVYYGNVALARSVATRGDAATLFSDQPLWDFVTRATSPLRATSARVRTLRCAVPIVGAALVVGAGLWGARHSESVMLLLAAAPSGVSEPMFGRDVSFYLLVLPVLRATVDGLTILVTVAASATWCTYLLRFREDLGLAARDAVRCFGRRPRLHLAGLACALLMVLAVRHQLAMADLVHSARGSVGGLAFPGYADVTAQAPALVAATLVAVACSVLLLVAARNGDWPLAAWATGGYAATVLVAWLYPAVIQQAIVLPNGLDYERRYLADFVRLTGAAYELDQAQSRAVPVSGGMLAPGDPAGVDIPIWSRAALLETLNQTLATQQLRRFQSAHEDRYVIDGSPRLVMIAVRELDPAALASQSWAARHIQLTHGRGAAAVLAGEVGPDASPRLLFRDSSASDSVSLDQPDIYFGEARLPFAIVQPLAASERSAPDSVEPDAPAPAAGIPLGPLERVAFAPRLGDPNFIFSGDLTPASRLLVRRQVQERLGALAPSLQFDREMYPVIADGRLFWLNDAYTTSQEYPLAAAHPGLSIQDGLSGHPFNYIRRAAIASIDAYSGETHFYQASDEPMARAYARVYPTLFEPLASMPPALRGHIRYPGDLFAVQAEILARFHGQDADALYRGDERWELTRAPIESTAGLETSYTVLIGDAGVPSLTLVQAFSPGGRSIDRQSLTAFLRGSTLPSGENSLSVLRYPRDRLPPGVLQAATRIGQDPAVTLQQSLWERGGSLVSRGPLLALPVGNLPIFVQTMFVQRSVRSTIPEPRRVVVAADANVIIEPTVSAALARVAAEWGAKGQLGNAGLSAAVIQTVRERLARAQAALAAGDSAQAADELAAMDNDLRQLDLLRGR
ncbi:MAG: UPF0182 family protein [Chloroflexi bacterium]|nr:UPF0182 family protein [Chloroflexota bacterium]